jgi:hypothetical protein
MDELLEALQEGSGRYDLSVSSWLRFVNAAQKRLDGLVDRPGSKGKVYQTLSRGFSSVVFQYCRAVYRVQATTVSERFSIAKVALDYLQELYTESPQATAKGPPRYWAKGVIREVPGGITVGTEQGYTGFHDVVGNAQLYTGLLIYPPADTSYTIVITGKFLDPSITEEGQQYSWWLANYPMILVQATLRELEVFMRNATGVQDYDKAIALQLIQIDYDLAEEAAVGATDMEG